MNDELSPVLEEENQKTKVIPSETKNEDVNALDSVYEGTASIPKHARTTKQRVIPTNPVPFEELYKEAFVSGGETDEERAIRMKKRKTTPMIQKIVTVIIVVPSVSAFTVPSSPTVATDWVPDVYVTPSV